MTKRAAIVAALLLAGAVLAVVGATAALSLLGGAFGLGGQPLSEADVQRSLAQPATAAPAASPGHRTSPVTRPHRHASAPPPSRPPTQAPAPSPASGQFASSGGTVFASCLSGRVTLTSWIPAQGYQTDGASRGPAGSAWVKFKSGGQELTVTVTCAGGRPRFAAAADERGGGGGDGGDGSGGGGGSSGGGGH
jgi:hypothetical protein